MIVAIDGPAGSGKSTVARALAAREGFVYLDTGAMYRAVTLKVLKAQVPVTETARVAKLAQEAVIEFVPGAPGEAPQVMLDGKDVTAAIRTAQIDQNVSAVASVPAVRQAMVAQQRAIAKNIDIVAEGRDMGTVVFPDAQVKVFLSADAAARAWRRTIEREGGNAAQPGAQVKDRLSMRACSKTFSPAMLGMRPTPHLRSIRLPTPRSSTPLAWHLSRLWMPLPTWWPWLKHARLPSPATTPQLLSLPLPRRTRLLNLPALRLPLGPAALTPPRPKMLARPVQKLPRPSLVRRL